jgi:hypothetical protein
MQYFLIVYWYLERRPAKGLEFMCVMREIVDRFKLCLQLLAGKVAV